MENRTKWSVYFALVEFFYWFAFAATNYLTVYMEHVGLTVTQVGIINTVVSVVAVLASPLGGVIADKMSSSRKATIISLLGMIITYALVPVSVDIKIFGLVGMLILILLFNFFKAPSSSLIETTVIDGCTANRSDYGKVRVFGTISYVIMSTGLGLFITEKNSSLTFYILALTMLPCIYYLIAIKPFDKGSKSSAKKSLKDLPYGKLFTNPYFIAYFLFSIFNNVPQMAASSFQPYLLKEVGTDMGMVGVIEAYRAMFEIPTLILSSKIEKKISYKNMVLVSALLIAVRTILCGSVTSFAGLIFATTFSGIASGFTIAGAYKFVYTLSPSDVLFTAQTLISATSSIAGIIGNLLGTVLIGSLGIKHLFTVMGIMILGVVVLYAASFTFIKKVMKKDFIDYSKK